MKNIALCGGGLAIFVMFATLGDTLVSPSQVRVRTSAMSHHGLVTLPGQQRRAQRLIVALGTREGMS